jgi:hypothetical protein
MIRRRASASKEGVCFEGRSRRFRVSFEGERFRVAAFLLRRRERDSTGTQLGQHYSDVTVTSDASSGSDVTVTSDDSKEGVVCFEGGCLLRVSFEGERFRVAAFLLRRRERDSTGTQLGQHYSDVTVTSDASSGSDVTVTSDDSKEGVVCFEGGCLLRVSFEGERFRVAAFLLRRREREILLGHSWDNTTAM